MNQESKKRILVFATDYLPHVGGAELALKEVTDRLGDFEFDLITARSDKKLPVQEKIGSINIFRAGEGTKFDKFLLPLKGIELAVKLHDKRKYSLVFSLMASFGGLAAYRFKKRFKNVPFLLNLQEGRDFNKDSGLKMFLFRKIVKRADFITAISGYLKEIALKNGGHRDGVGIIPNGVNVGEFSREFSYGELSGLKDDLGIRPDDKLITSVSRLTHKNGIDTLIKAMPMLDESYKLLLAGEGEKREELIDLTKSPGVNQRVMFAGTVRHDTLPKILAISHVFVRPSRSEGLGTAFLEAMAARVPVVATPVGGITDYVKSPETGLFCSVDDPKSVADKIKLLMEDKKLRDEIVKNAYRLVREKYDWNRVAIEYGEVFRSLMD